MPRIKIPGLPQEPIIEIKIPGLTPGQIAEIEQAVTPPSTIVGGDAVMGPIPGSIAAGIKSGLEAGFIPPTPEGRAQAREMGYDIPEEHLYTPRSQWTEGQKYPGRGLTTEELPAYIEKIGKEAWEEEVDLFVREMMFQQLRGAESAISKEVLLWLRGQTSKREERKQREKGLREVGIEPKERSARYEALLLALEESKKVESGEAPLPPEMDPDLYWKSIADIRLKLATAREIEEVTESYLLAGVDIPQSEQEKLDAKIAAVYGEASPFVDLAEGTVDVMGALSAGVSEAVLIKIGVERESIKFARAQNTLRRKYRVEDMQSRIADRRLREKALVQLSGFRDGDSYDLAAAIEAGNIAAVREAQEGGLFDSLDVVEAQKFSATHTLLPDGQWIADTDLDAVLKQSPRAHNILTTQGYGSYLSALADARATLTFAKSPWEDTYNVKMALMTQHLHPPGLAEAAELLFDKKVMDALYKRYPFLRPGYEWREPDLSGKPSEFLGLEVSPSLASALAVMGTVVVVEPTPVGELVFLALLGSLALYTAWKGAQGETVPADISLVAETFKAQTGREIGVSDLSSIDLSAVVSAGPITTTTGVSSIALPLPKKGFGEELIPPKQDMPSMVVTKMLPLRGKGFGEELIPPKEEMPSMVVTKALPLPPKGFGEELIPPKVDMPSILYAETALKEAAEELKGLTIYPKALTVAELDRLFDVKTTGTEQALIALDEAVTEAHQKGEISDDDAQDYHEARERFITRKSELESSVSAAMMEMDPSLSEGLTPNELLSVLEGAPYGGTSREWTEYLRESAKRIVTRRLETEEAIKTAAGVKARWADVKEHWLKEMERVTALQVGAVREVEGEVEGYGANLIALKLRVLNEAMAQAMVIGQVEFLPADMPAEEIAAMVSAALDTLINAAAQAATKAYADAMEQGLTEAVAQSLAQTAAQTAARAATQAAVKEATQAITDTAVRTAAQTMVKTALRALEATVTSAVVENIASLTATAVTTAVKTVPRIPPPPPPPPRFPSMGAMRGEKRQRIPAGSMTWYQGELLRGEGDERRLYPVWKYIAPPWKGFKPQTLYAPPMGALRTEDRTAEGTIQIIGKPGANVPETASVDLGAFDVFISNYGRKIDFRAGGERTDVGKSLDSPTVGMSIPAAEDIDTTIEVKSRVTGRSTSRKKKPRRKRGRLYDNPLDTQLQRMRF